MTSKRPEILVYAGPNGSGKSTIKNAFPISVDPYINADDIKKVNDCTDLEAAQEATRRREECVDEGRNFSFETVLSTDRNLELLRRAKEKGFFIRGVFVLTVSPELNVWRVRDRVQRGGHPVPEEKVHSRYEKSLNNLPEFLALCDVCHIYDNTANIPKRIFKKRKHEIMYWTNQYWRPKKIANLVQLTLPAKPSAPRHEE